VTPSDLVSFVVVTYNNVLTIRECLRSVLDQVDVGLELIVVDNASSDGTVEILRGEFSSWRIVANRTNLGFASACNLGAGMASARYLAFVNPDAKLAPNWAAEIRRVLDRDFRLGAADGKLLLWRDPGTINALGSHLNLLGFGCMAHFNEADISDETLIESAYPSGAAFVVRQEAFAEAGGFDDSYFLYQDDVDLGLRLRLLGKRVATVSSAVGYHDYKQTLTPAKTRRLECNRWRTLIKNMPLQYFIRVGPLLILFEVVIVLVIAKRGLLKAKVQGYLDLFAGLRAAMKARRAIGARSEERLRLLDLLTDDFPAFEGMPPRLASIGKRILTGYLQAIGAGSAGEEKHQATSGAGRAKEA
jgi:GT2 family glycosyltransferase